MPIRTLLAILTISLTFLPALEAREFWNGTECVVCPESKEYGPGEGNQPGGAGLDSRVLENQVLVSRSLQAQTETVVGGNDAAMLYRLVGPIKHVDVDRHRIVVKNRLNHKNESVYVYDPILPYLRERNVVEVWKKPGSDLAERIHRIS
jgi:hypothetical protein